MVMAVKWTLKEKRVPDVLLDAAVCVHGLFLMSHIFIFDICFVRIGSSIDFMDVLSTT